MLNFKNCWHFNIYKQDKFHARLSMKNVSITSMPGEVSISYLVSVSTCVDPNYSNILNSTGLITPGDSLWVPGGILGIVLSCRPCYPWLSLLYSIVGVKLNENDMKSMY